MTDLTPWQRDRDEAERSGALPPGMPHTFHRHFASDAIHRDGGPECDQPGSPRRVYVFDPEFLTEHELFVARYAAAHPREFLPEGQVSLFSTWYRSHRDGETWCESSDPGEVAGSGGDSFQKLETWQVSGGWQPWDPSV
jgi:hypothetical protein